MTDYKGLELLPLSAPQPSSPTNASCERKVSNPRDVCMKGNRNDGWRVNGGCGVQVFHALTEAEVNKSSTHIEILNVSGFRSRGSCTKARDAHNKRVKENIRRKNFKHRS